MSDDTNPSLTPTTPPLPEEPMPVPPIPEDISVPSTPTTSAPQIPDPEPNAEKVMERILDTQGQESVVVPPTTSNTPDNASFNKKSGKGPLLALVALLLIVLPVSVFFISQQNQQLSDLRSRATGTTYSPGDPCATAGSCGPGLRCNLTTHMCESLGTSGYPCTTSNQCANGYVCTGGTCEGNPITDSCGRDSDSGAPACCTGACTGVEVCEPPNRRECNTNGIHCTIDADGCREGNDTGGDDDTTLPTPTPTLPPGTPTATPPPGGASLAYCSYADGCIPTDPIYNVQTMKDQWGNTCAQNLQTYREGLTTGVCYVSVAACNPNCGGKCQDIKIYKGHTQVNPSSLKAGDEVTIQVKGTGGPTKARFRINGGTWQEQTQVNNTGAFYMDYTIPDGITDFVIEGEVFVNGAWR